MGRKEFIEFMDEQIKEIEKYKNEKIKCDPATDGNMCVFEWIEKYARKFREEWEKS